MSTLKADTISNVAGTKSSTTANLIDGAAKAWVNFNGTGTVAIRASFNVSSITDNGTGDYTANFTNALADANYAFVGTIDDSATVLSTIRQYGSLTAPQTTSCRFRTNNPTPTQIDPDRVCVAVFR